MKLFVQRDKEFRSALYDIMGFYPHNVELYRIAFAHKSQEYKSKKMGDRPLNNERLEFLGDAVLETVVSDIVYHHFKNKREGFLTNTRSKIVSRESLGKLAKDLGIDRLIQSHTHSKAHNSFMAGNAFEALMGAIYLDRGFDYAFRFIEMRIMGSVLDLEGVAHKEVNFKSKLLEWSQKNRIRIEFKDKQTGNSGSTPSFFTTIILEGLFAGDGKGFSKKEAHQNASKDALTRMRREPKFIDDVFSSKEKRTAMEADPCFVLPVIDEIEADLAREAETQKEQPKRENKREQKPKKEQQPKPEQPKKEQKPKDEQPKKEQKPKDESKKPESMEGKADKKKAEPSKKEQQNKAEARKEQQPKVEKPSEPATPIEGAAEPAPEPKTEPKPDEVLPKSPIVVPIALEEIFPEKAEETDDAPKAEDLSAETPSAAEPSTSDPTDEVLIEVPAAEEPVIAESPVPAEPAENVVSTETAPTSTEPIIEEPAEMPDAEQSVPAPAKKAHRRGKRQNAAGFTNTDTIPAETSHRAEKAAKKVEEAKKEKARKEAKKSARKAARGIEDAEVSNAAPEMPDSKETAEKPAAKPAQKKRKAKPSADSKPAAATSTAEAEGAAPAKKPRRRRKNKADLPSEAPNPERENAISAAEEAAYRQLDNE